MSHDKHLGVSFSPFKMPDRREPTPEDRTRMQQQMKHNNRAFRKVEVLPGNIGYVKFDGFMPADVCAPNGVAAMGFVAHTGALILHLRDNGGGDPAMVTFIATFLFDKRYQ